MGESSMNDNEAREPVNTGEQVEVTKPRLWSAARLKAAASACIKVAIVTGIAFATVKVTTPAVVTFDMKGTMDLFIQQTLAQKVPEEQSKGLLLRFNRAMTDSLQSWQDSHNAIILVAPAVVSRQTDITQDIRADIAQRMQSGNEGAQ